MRATAEVRWFYKGDVPEAVVAWFGALPGEPAEEARTDRYLRPTDAALNLKWREGQVEVKRRDAPGDLFRFHQRATGRIEPWRKWSFDVAERTSARTSGDGALWADVSKARRKIAYRIGEEGRVVVHRDAGAPLNGCDLELTRLHAKGAAWWSVCLEAFGDERALRDTLTRTARYVFEAAAAPPLLDAAHSMGYAAWLLDVGR